MAGSVRVGLPHTHPRAACRSSGPDRRSLAAAADLGIGVPGQARAARLYVDSVLPSGTSCSRVGDPWDLRHPGALGMLGRPRVLKVPSRRTGIRGALGRLRTAWRPTGRSRQRSGPLGPRRTAACPSGRSP